MLYNCAKLFGFTPHQTRELSVEEYAMLIWAAEQENEEQSKAMQGKPTRASRGGSSVDGTKVTSVSQLMSMANKLGA